MIDFYGNYSMTIDGLGVHGPETMAVVNPANGNDIATVPAISRPQFDAAVASAKRAFPAWRDTPIADRRKALLAISRALSEHAADFTRLFTLEQGRPLEAAGIEIQGAAFWAATMAEMDIPVLVNEDSDERRSETHHVPLGVVAGIVPWNFPVHLAIWKICPALLAGNTIIVKPSPYTPLTMLKLAELVRENLPPGVFNVISGGDEVGPWMTSHPDIAKVSFTGSTATGKRVMESAAGSLKRITLELGGNDAAIVLPDVDVAEVVPQLFWSAFLNSGQICIANKRTYVHDDIYDAVASGLVAYARAIRVGDGLEPGVGMGPLQNRRQYERVKALIERTRAEGCTFLLESRIEDGPGNFIGIHIVDNPPDTSAVVVEEAFGPVLPLLRFGSVEEVIARANDSEYGLGGTIWTKDIALARRIAARLDTGTVWINECFYIMPWTPFAGHKASGFGVENGQAGLLEYTAPQTISIRKHAAGTEAA